MSPTSEADDDLALAQRVLDGDEDAVEIFVERMRCIPRFLAHQNDRSGSVLSAGELEDLAQDTFAEIWRRLDEFRGESALTTWAWRFCTLQLAGRRRRVGRLLHRQQPLEHEERDRAVEASALDDQVLMDAVAGLPEDERAAITGKHFEVLSFSALAERTGVSAGTLKGRYYRGLERLRAKLGRAFGVERDRGGVR